jgi:hypothetical protein
MLKGRTPVYFSPSAKFMTRYAKMIIDGGSFTNFVRSDLVHVLSLSIWRLPTPCYCKESDAR